MNQHDALAAFREETAPSPEAVARLVGGVAGARVDADALLRELPPGSTADVARLVSAVQRSGVEEHAWKPRPRWGVWGVAVAGTAIAAAVALWVSTRAADPIMHPDVGPAPVTLAIELSSPAAPREMEIADGIDVVVEGRGEVGGTPTAPELRWSQGTVGVSVEPGRGLALAVITREARVRVVGTAFEVHRDALGTAVSVSHGRVEVTCTSGGVSLLEPGESITCLPVTAASLLARAHALVDRGSDPEDVLATLQLGQRIAAPPVDAEIAVLRMRTLIESGARSRAFDEAEAWLATGRPERRPEVLAIAATLAYGAGGCAFAAPYLDELRGSGRVPPEVEACSGH